MSRESSAGRGENAGLADLGADLDLDAGLPGEFSHGKTAGNAAALGNTDVEEITGAKLDEPSSLLDGDQGFISHDRYACFVPNASQPFEIIRAYRLFNGFEVKRSEQFQLLHRFRRAPCAVGVGSQFDVLADGLAHRL